MELYGVPVKIIGKEESSFRGGAGYCPPDYEVLALKIAGRTAPTPHDLIIFTGRPDMPILLVEETTSHSTASSCYCFLWDLEKNTYLAGVTDNSGLPVSWPATKGAIAGWLDANLNPAENETILETSHPTSPPYPECSTSSGWRSHPMATISGFEITDDETCPEDAAYAVDSRAGAGASRSLHEEATANMEPNDPRIPGTPQPYPNKGIYEAEGTWEGHNELRRYIRVRIKGLHTGSQWPYEAHTTIMSDGTGEASSRGYHAYDDLGRRMLAEETEIQLDWTSSLTVGLSGFGAGETTAAYHYWEHIIREPYLNPHYRHIVETEEEGENILLTGGITGYGYAGRGKLVIFAHWRRDISDQPTPDMDASVVVDSRFCNIFDTGLEYESLDPIAGGHANPAFNEACRQLLVLGRQSFSTSWPCNYDDGVAFRANGTAGYACMAWTPGEIIMPEIQAYQWKE